MGQGCGSMVESLPRMHEVLGSITNTTKKSDFHNFFTRSSWKAMALSRLHRTQQGTAPVSPPSTPIFCDHNDNDDSILYISQILY